MMMMQGRRRSVFLVFAFISFFFIFCQCVQPYKGRWKLLTPNIGISAMHIALLPNDKLVMFDRTDTGPSNISLSEGKCRNDPHDHVLQVDCTAHAVEFDPVSLAVRPLTVQTDTWCSSGALDPDGVLVQTGGFNDGELAVRHYKQCDTCDWTEDLNGLMAWRWYASNQILPDGRMIVVGGRDQYTYEFVPKASDSDRKLYQLPFLHQTKDSVLVENNLYPFLHLMPDGNLFIFANVRSILFDYVHNVVLKEYPVMPGGVARSYPSTGSSVLLPLKLMGETEPQAEVLICGGTKPYSFLKSISGKFLRTSSSCGRMVINSPNPNWVMEEMPLNRAMGDMILLPTGDVLIINGAAKGTAGWYVGRKPVLKPVLYKPETGNEGRFEVLNPSTIPRMYHSVAHLLSDGRVLVAGSNPNEVYNFTTTFRTELSVEAFSPPYMSSTDARPRIIGVHPGMSLSYNQSFNVEFVSMIMVDPAEVYVTMVAPSFTTHSLSMHQRLLVLDMGLVGQTSNGHYTLDVTSPRTPFLAPPGYYILFVVHAGAPSKGQWIHIN